MKVAGLLFTFPELTVQGGVKRHAAGRLNALASVMGRGASHPPTGNFLVSAKG